MPEHDGHALVRFDREGCVLTAETWWEGDLGITGDFTHEQHWTPSQTDQWDRTAALSAADAELASYAVYRRTDWKPVGAFSWEADLH